jgi:hypothetical protein
VFENISDDEMGRVSGDAVLAILSLILAAIQDQDADIRHHGLDLFRSMLPSLSYYGEHLDIGEILGLIAGVLQLLFDSFYGTNQNPHEFTAFNRVIETALKELPDFISHFPNLPQTVSLNLQRDDVDPDVLWTSVNILDAYADRAPDLLLAEFPDHIESLLRLSKTAFDSELDHRDTSPRVARLSEP